MEKCHFTKNYLSEDTPHWVSSDEFARRRAKGQSSPVCYIADSLENKALLSLHGLRALCILRVWYPPSSRLDTSNMLVYHPSFLPFLTQTDSKFRDPCARHKANDENYGFGRHSRWSESESELRPSLTAGKVRMHS